MAHRVLVVDDHKMVREGLKAILERSNEFSVAGEVPDGQTAIQFCRTTLPDIVLMDIELGG
jgi:two-component system, NarL family, invasion response regulator UvrY